MEAEFLCPICLEICENALEAVCCHRIFCQDCLHQVNCCPNCRKKPPTFTSQEAHFARRVIGNMQMECPLNCGAKFARSERDSHKRSCPLNLIFCPAPECQYKGLRGDLANHLATEHVDKLVENASLLFSAAAASSDTANSQLLVDISDNEGDPFAKVNRKRNEAGRIANLGSTGKYYCSVRFPSMTCRCCNGHCGPTNGCNCAPCMKLDLWRYGLSGNWLVNSDGFPSHLSSHTNHFYCGRRVQELQRNPHCDGFCGPHNGPNCSACQKLDTQKQQRYGGILN